MTGASHKMLRLLVVMPSWVGDAVMATPTLRLIRQSFPGIFVGGLVRPGIDQLLAGTDFFDEVHSAHSTGVLGPKFVAAKIRPRRYDTALLLTNSFSTALIVRIAGIPRRIGYDRDARGLLLTDRAAPSKRPDGRWAPLSAVEYYRALAAKFLLGVDRPAELPLELATTPEEEADADAILRHAGISPGAAMAVLNPGGNNIAKRWPARRFAQVAEHLSAKHGMTVVVNGSPAEKELVEHVATLSAVPVVRLSHLGITLGSLKAIIKRSRVMVTNDTGPRHLAAAFGVPVVTLFGPTDHRWTTIPTRPGAPEQILIADPTLPESEVADDHPERCRVDRILLEDVIGAVDKVLAAGTPSFRP